MRYSSPVCDLVYYLFCCTSKNLRDEHYSEFIDNYYMSLSDFVKRFVIRFSSALNCIELIRRLWKAHDKIKVSTIHDDSNSTILV